MYNLLITLKNKNTKKSMEAEIKVVANFSSLFDLGYNSFYIGLKL